jgi:CubicO group peptidase (beta-lactamase class C family)
MGVGCRRRRKGNAMKQKMIFLAVAACLSLAAAEAGAKGAEEYWPAESWRTSTPEAQGLSSADLAKAFDFIAKEQINIHSLLVIRNGYLLLEAHFYPNTRDDLHDICSCTKSVSSTLVGIALDQGKIRSVKENLTELFPGRQLQNDSAGKRRITLEHLLTTV